MGIQEKLDLQQQLEETESDLTLAEQRAESLQLHLSRIRGEHEHALAEKDDQLDDMRKSITKQVDAVRESMEEEVRLCMCACTRDFVIACICGFNSDIVSSMSVLLTVN